MSNELFRIDEFSEEIVTEEYMENLLDLTEEQELDLKYGSYTEPDEDGVYYEWREVDTNEYYREMWA